MLGNKHKYLDMGRGGGTLGQFLSTLCLGHIFQQGSSILDKARDKLTKSGVAGSPYHVDFKTRFKLFKDLIYGKLPPKKKKLT